MPPSRASPTTSATRPRARATSCSRTGRPRSGRGVARSRCSLRAPCSTSARRYAPRSARSTGPAPRRRRTGTATWTARCARASAPPPRSWQRSSLRLRAVLLTVLAFGALATPAAARNRFDVQVLAHVPPPGQPGLSYVAPDRTIYVGTFTNSAGTANGPSKVFAYSPTGQLVRTYTIQGQDPNADNGVQPAAMDAGGNLYLLDQHPARVIKLDPRRRQPRDPHEALGERAEGGA